MKQFILFPLILVTTVLCLGCGPRHSTGVALGAGRHGAGVAVFSDNFFLSPHYAGISVGLPVLYPRHRSYHESGSVVYQQGAPQTASPAPAPAAAPSLGTQGYRHPSQPYPVAPGTADGASGTVGPNQPAGTPAQVSVPPTVYPVMTHESASAWHRYEAHRRGVW